MCELDLDAIVSNERGFPLLQSTDLLHLGVRIAAVNPGPWRARAIRHDDSAEPLVGLAKTLGDAVVRHNLNVVLRAIAPAGVRRESGTKTSADGWENFIVRKMVWLAVARRKGNHAGCGHERIHNMRHETPYRA